MCGSVCGSLGFNARTPAEYGGDYWRNRQKSARPFLPIIQRLLTEEGGKQVALLAALLQDWCAWRGLTGSASENQRFKVAEV
jgi:hypothetical protein